MAKPKIAGIDAGHTLTKVCWKEGDLFVFTSTADVPVDELRTRLEDAGITRVHVAGIGHASPLTEGFEVMRPAMIAPAAEIQLQAEGAKRLLAMTGPGGEDTFFLVSIGSGTSYTFVVDGVATHFPYGNADAGKTMQRLTSLMGLPLFDEVLAWAEKGKHLDRLIKEQVPELDDGFVGDLVLSHFGNVRTMACDQDIHDVCATFLHKLAVQTVRDIVLISNFKGMPDLDKVFYIGSLVGRSPTLREYLWSWTAKLGKRPMYHGWGEYALALGAYHMA